MGSVKGAAMKEFHYVLAYGIHKSLRDKGWWLPMLHTARV